MAAAEDNSDGASIALLRRLRAGATVDLVVHHVDVCSATPEDLVADLEPAPGTDSAAWYFYCPKKFKNAQGKASGHRQRAIAGGDTCWHAEGRPKEAAGGTTCNLSYGRKNGRSFSRLGWCMTEYDDHPQQDAAGYVLCKVYRSPRAQVKTKPSSSSGSKRKAAAGYHPAEARPAKLSHDQDTFFCHDYAMPPCYEYEPRMIGGNVGYDGQQQQHMEMFGGGEEKQSPTQDGEFVDTMYGPLPSVVAQVNVEEWIGCPEMFGGEEGHGLVQQSSKQDDEFAQVFAEPTVEELLGQETTTASGTPPDAVPLLSDADLFDGLESFFGVPPEEQTVQMQQPRAEFVQAPRSTAMACQQQQSQWVMQSCLLQGPTLTAGFQLPCLMC